MELNVTDNDLSFTKIQSTVILLLCASSITEQICFGTFQNYTSDDMILKFRREIRARVVTSTCFLSVIVFMMNLILASYFRMSEQSDDLKFSQESLSLLLTGGATGVPLEHHIP